MSARELTEPLSLRERRQLRTRADIVAAVITVISDAGLSGVTIESICSAAGISRGTVYAYFPGGRDELLRAAYAELGAQLVARTRSRVAEAAGWSERIAAHGTEMFVLAAEPRLGDFFQVSGPALIVEGVERGVGSRASTEMIAAELRRAAAAGEVGTSADPEVIATLLVGALREAAIAVSAGRVTADTAIAAFRTLVHGLAA